MRTEEKKVRSTRWRWFALALVACLAAVLGFSLLQEGESGPSLYDDPGDLIAALEEKGIACAGASEIEGSADAPFKAVTCDADGTPLTISVSFTDEIPHVYETLFQKHVTGRPAVVGPNWIVEAPYDELPLAKEVRAALGGRIVESHLTERE